jgi:hypothetical protein
MGVPSEHYVDSQSRVESADSIRFVRQHHGGGLECQATADQGIGHSFLDVVKPRDAQRDTGPNHVHRRVDEHMRTDLMQPFTDEACIGVIVMVT